MSTQATQGVASNIAAETRAVAQEAAAEIASKTGVAHHDMALILGSGWAGATQRLGEELARLPATSLPGFRPPTVAGHHPDVVSIRLHHSKKTALVLPRTHLYEGHGVAAVAHPIRTAAETGCRTVVLTNGCGSLNPAWRPGTVVLLCDHINLTGTTPVTGAEFVDMCQAYSPQLRQAVRERHPDIPEGVYVQTAGPQYETPAEVAMAQRLGGDLVGMSTALETIAARAAGMQVLGLSLVTNLAAGLSESGLNHQEVLAAGQDAADQLQELLADIVTAL